MTENQLTKLKGRLLNIQTQINGASLLLSKSEPEINSMMQEANKIISDVMIKCESIKTKEVEEQPKKKRKKEYYSQPTVIIARSEPPTYNLRCRNYSELRDRNNNLISRTCIVGMDLCYCSKQCAYATNNVCSLRG